MSKSDLPTSILKLSENIIVRYCQVPSVPDPSKITLILLHSFATSLELYESQFKNKQLVDTCNLLAIDELGHGQTLTNHSEWTYWDTAQICLDLMNKLNIEKAVILGTSQGGFIGVRMALL